MASPAASTGAGLRPIGVIRSVLKARSEAPKQGSEGAPDAWLVATSSVSTPRSDRRNPLTGVFAIHGTPVVDIKPVLR